MILTTNRATKIDSAFESRIDMTLAYEALSETLRTQVWRNFIRKLGSKSHITEEDILRLAKIPINGRQIKSAIKTARVLAIYEGLEVGIKHLNIVIGLREKASKALGLYELE